ncbi:hypothetical protein AHF37_05708, partial [Paragonimus kellicotti]
SEHINLTYSVTCFYSPFRLISWSNHQTIYVGDFMLSVFSVKCGRRHAAVASTLVCRLRLSRHSSNYARLSPLADAFNIASSAAHCESSCSGNRAGLFGNSHLTTPHGFTELVVQANDQCRILLDEALSSDRTRKMVQVCFIWANGLFYCASAIDHHTVGVHV